MKKTQLAKALTVAFFTAAFSLSFANNSIENKSPAITQATAKSIVETISVLSALYVDPIPQQDFEEKVISGILSKFDSHSSYLTKEELGGFLEEMDGQYAGLGMIAKRPGKNQIGVKIEEILSGGPADIALLKEGDVITKVNDKILDKSLSENIKLLKGKPGTIINISFIRGEKILETKVTRNFIVTKSVFSNFCECNGNKVLFLKVVGFNDKTGEEALELIRDGMKKNPTAIVLDLKDNPGGMLQSSVELSSLFLKKDTTVVSTKERGEDSVFIKVGKESVGEEFWNKRQELIKMAPSLVSSIPVYVMINSGSASASEIVAAALKDNKRSVLIGEKTFGKGSVQRMIPLSNGGAVKVTIARYYTPSGETIQAKGVVPDILMVDDRPWRKSIIEMQRKQHLEKTPNAFIREEDLPGHLQAKYQNNKEVEDEFEAKIKEENIFIEKKEPYEKRFSYHPLSSDGKMDSLTARVIQEIEKKNKSAKNKNKKENKT